MHIDNLHELSNERIRKNDRDRRSLESTVGKVEPELENMKLGEARKFKLAVLHIDIDRFKNLVKGLSQCEYLRFVSSYLTEMTLLVDNRNDIVGRPNKYLINSISILQFGKIIH